MAKNYNVADGAILTCSLGTKMCKLRVPDFHGARVGEKAEATINDYKPGTNIILNLLIDNMKDCP